MKVLLSIKPEYAQKIFEGEKKYEYRKSMFKRPDIDTVIVYATKPIGKVVGEFKIDKILEGSPNFIWEETKLYSGINEKEYIKYFAEKEKGFAIGIKNIIAYKDPLDLIDLNPQIKRAPQSFMYV
ncbi:50S ribosomal protein L22/uncharacterised domain fusion protein [Clostridium tetani]|uniref:ASCH domain-containing protein n=1 Tax=Clostridium tetani TaxID=1513 RepID=A0ABY0EM82_CLOTA|nr:ASCH domain-containing protein [Clostridium tetani]AVP53583.1 ASCH domain-containing protein [Clostridium tetani]KHO39483.1 phage associated protein [Clostridium tetani]RXI53375.1 ASCH domain-containing protein [Clostridium tetani]RXI67269.1 ASCH domain-containing protein [Clostridium tetani]RXI75178.1 ASCH domain-containing protein [Clostridium tetani]